MNSKRKLIMSMLVISFVLVSLVAVVALIFAATQHTIKTTLNITYTASQVDATVSATIKVANNEEEHMVTQNGAATSIKFSADDTVDPNGTSLVPASAVNLDSQNTYVVFKYTFQNTGSNDLIASFKYLDSENLDKNIELTYSEDGINYKIYKKGILVEGFTTESYYLKLKIANIAMDAEFSGDISWLLEAHNHNYADHALYTISGETVYEIPACSCGKGDVDEKTIVSNAIIVTPDTADGIVRGTNVPEYADLTGKVIVFKAGTYPNAIAGGTKNYNNVIFAGEYTGEEKSVIIENGAYFHVQDSCYIDGMEFTNFIFKDKMHISKQETYIKNVNINNCEFYYTKGDVGSNPAIIINPAMPGGAHATSENLTVKDCIIDGYYQGVLAYQSKNVTIENCVFTNMKYNAIALQLNTGNTELTSGEINISNNIIINTVDRAIRFGKVGPATVNISNNDFVNATDDSGELLKASSLTSTTFSFTDNTFNNRFLTNKTNTADVENYIIVK